MSAMQRQERPAVVTLVAVLIYISAAFGLVTSAVYFLQRNDAAFSAQTGLDSTGAVVASIMELLISVLLLFVASGVMSGQKGARLLVAVVVGLRMALSMYWLVSGDGPGQGGLATIVVGLVVLWALYGHAESERFFSGRMAAS